MSRTIRSRRAPASLDLPLYARLLRLRHLAPSGFLCFVFLEGTVALGVLLALAELVSWWGVLILPATVAGMVKLNDVIAGVLSRPASAAAATDGTPKRSRPLVRPAVVAAAPARSDALGEPVPVQPDSGAGRAAFAGGRPESDSGWSVSTGGRPESDSGWSVFAGGRPESDSGGSVSGEGRPGVDPGQADFSVGSESGPGRRELAIDDLSLGRARTVDLSHSDGAREVGRPTFHAEPGAARGGRRRYRAGDMPGQRSGSGSGDRPGRWESPGERRGSQDPTRDLGNLSSGPQGFDLPSAPQEFGLPSAPRGFGDLPGERRAHGDVTGEPGVFGELPGERRGSGEILRERERERERERDVPGGGVPIVTAPEPFSPNSGAAQVWADDPETIRQRARQSAARRYE